MLVRARTLLVTALLTLGSLGVAAADHGTWLSATGPSEPNTKWDTSEFMFQTANKNAVEKVYFNGLVIHEDLLLSPADSYDANLQGGTILTPVAMRMAAILGFWRDCNEDGYIGMAGAPFSAGSFSIYPRDLAGSSLNEGICPRGSPYNPTNAITGQPNAYIDEFRWIGRALATGAPTPICNAATGMCVRATAVEDPYDVSDYFARVWVDWNYPGGRHVPHQGLTAQPPGTYDDSEGTLKYVDDAAQQQFSSLLGSTWTAKPKVGRCYADPQLLGGPDGTCGAWPLYQVERLVSDRETVDEEPTSVVTVFDIENDTGGDNNPCDDGLDQTLPTGHRIALADVAPRLHPEFLVEGSLQGTLTNVYRGANVHNLTDQRNDRACNGPVFGPDSPESSQLDAEPTHRIATDYLGYTPDQRYRLLAAQGYDYAPSDFLGVGVRSGPVAIAGDSPGWYGTFGWTGRPPRTGWGSLNNTYTTFYADVTCGAVPIPGCRTNNTAARPDVSLPAKRHNAFVYGSEFCNAFTTGPSNVNPSTLWECSISVWEKKRADDNAVGPNADIPRRAILGETYDVRDVDCYDNTLSEYTGDLRAGIGNCAPTHG